MSFVSHAEPVLLMGYDALMPAAPPFGWYDHCNKKSQGAASAIIKRIFHHLDVPYQYTIDYANTYPSYRHRLQAQIGLLEADKIDFLVIPENAVNHPNLTVMKSPFFIFNTILVSRKEDSYQDLETIRSLKGAIGKEAKLRLTAKGVVLGAQEIRPRQFSKAMSDLIHKKFDYIILVKHSAYLSSYYQGVGKNVNFHALSIVDYGVHIAAKKGGRYASLLPAIEDQMVSYQESGLTDRLIDANLKLWIRQSHCASGKGDVPGPEQNPG